MKKNISEKKIAPPREKLPPEKYWDTLVKKVYFLFYSRRMADNDGFPLWPNWNEQTRGMEASSLKKIIIRLRTISEDKGIEWTEEIAIDNLHNFLQKAYNIGWIGKHLLCSVMNKYKDMIISSDYTPSLVEKIIFEWYKQFPDKEKKQDVDRTAAQISIGYLKQQYIINKLAFTDESVMQTMRTIFHHIKKNEFWSQKTFRSCANNLQGFISELKANKKNGTAEQIRGNDYSRGFEKNGNDSPDNKKDFGSL